MNKKFSLILFVFCITICGIDSKIVNASIDKPQSLEEIYPEIGYKTVEEAVREFEQHFKQDLKLPLRVPPIKFTHYFGRFTDLEGDINDSLEIVLINQNSAKHHYKINIRPVKYKIPMREKNVFKLKNGNKASYANVTGFNLFVFERDGWQYIIGVDKRVSDKVTPEILVEIANSIDYPNEIKNR